MKGNRTQWTPRQKAKRTNLLRGVLFLFSTPFILASEVLAEAPSFGQSGPPTSVTAPLPRQCQTPGSPSPQVSDLLQALSNHPTANGYKALGALYAQKGVLAWALGASR